MWRLGHDHDLALLGPLRDGLERDGAWPWLGHGADVDGVDEVDFALAGLDGGDGGRAGEVGGDDVADGTALEL